MAKLLVYFLSNKIFWINKAKIKVIGLRPGEKIHETLITEEECRHTKEYSDLFIILPEFPFWVKEGLEDSKIVEPYSSDNNTEWLTKEELKEMITFGGASKDGSSSGGRVTLEWGNLKYFVDVNWLSGKIDINDE